MKWNLLIPKLMKIFHENGNHIIKGLEPSSSICMHDTGIQIKHPGQMAV